MVIEGTTPVRSSQSWFDGATQIHDDYERSVPELFVSNLCFVATEGKDLRYGSIGLPVDLWGYRIKRTVSSMLRPNTVLNLLGTYTAYTTGKRKRRAEIVARYQQVEAANRIVAGHPKPGLILALPGPRQVAADAVHGARRFPTRNRHLLEVHLAVRAVLHPRVADPPLQRP